MNGTIVALVVAILVVGILIFVAITLTQNRRQGFNREKYQSAWLAINSSLKKDSPDSANMAIVKADKLLDQALIELGIPGDSLGERLKKLRGRFSDENSLWAAHKMRNRIAHETNFNADYGKARRALVAYKNALRDLGAI